MTAFELMDDIMQLSRADRSYLATRIIESLEEGEGLSEEWIQELDQRLEKWESGASKPVRSKDLHSEIKARLAL